MTAIIDRGRVAIPSTKILAEKIVKKGGEKKPVRAMLCETDDRGRQCYAAVPVKGTKGVYEPKANVMLDPKKSKEVCEKPEGEQTVCESAREVPGSVRAGMPQYEKVDPKGSAINLIVISPLSFGYEYLTSPNLMK